MKGEAHEGFLALASPVFLLPLVAQTATRAWLTESVGLFLSALQQLLLVLVVIVAPLLLFYAFVKSSLEVVKASRLAALPLLLAQTEEVVDRLLRGLDAFVAVLMSFFLIIVPFTLLLVFWKGFTKLVRA